MIITAFDFVGLVANIAGRALRQSGALYQDKAQTMPVNFTGWSAVFVLYDGSGERARLTSAGGGITLGGVLGTWALDSEAQDPAPTVPTAHGRYSYALEFLDATGNVDTSMRGAYELVRDVTAEPAPP